VLLLGGSLLGRDGLLDVQRELNLSLVLIDRSGGLVDEASHAGCLDLVVVLIAAVERGEPVTQHIEQSSNQSSKASQYRRFEI
jgi:hypothetical protein